MAFSSTPEHGRHMHSSGALVDTYETDESVNATSECNIYQITASTYFTEFPFARLGLGTEQRDGRLAFARLLAAHARTLHLPDFAARHLRGRIRKIYRVI